MQQANQVIQLPRVTAKERLIITVVEVTQILIVLHFRVVVVRVIRAAQTCCLQLRVVAIRVSLRNLRMQAFATEVKDHSMH